MGHYRSEMYDEPSEEQKKAWKEESDKRKQIVSKLLEMLGSDDERLVKSVLKEFLGLY